MSRSEAGAQGANFPASGGSLGILHFIINQYEPKQAVKYFGSNYEAFKKEAEILQKLEHTNIVRFIDCYNHGQFDEENLYGIVMERCEQGSLARVIFSPEFEYSMATVMWWIGDLFAVIHYLKQKSLVHCDIKPSTILLDKNYVLKLSAFGNYREQEEKSRITFKSDMFSAGVTLWEMIERRSPTFSANYQIEKLQAAEKDIEEIFMSCVDEDAQKRPLPAEAQKQVSKIQKIFETVFQVTPRRRPENSSLVMPDGYDQEIVEIFKDNSSTTYWEYKSTTGMEPEAFEQLDSGYQTDSSTDENWLQSTPKVPGKPPQSHNLVSEKVLDVALKEDFLKTALQEDLMHTEMTACLKLLESGTNWRVPFITDDFMYPEPETPGLWWSIQEDVPKFSCAGFDSFPTMLELSYEKMVIIGRGTFGDVYRLKGMDDVSIAVKIFVYEHISWTDEVYRNLNAIKNLKDSNLVEYFEVSDRYVEGGRIYFGIFMEYFEYGDLLKFIMKPSWVYMMVNVFEWAVHLFSAISFLEQHQLIHWNIKTSNVLMGKSFILKLGGFEMIESFDKADLQRSKGTERYMSPEVLFGPKFSEKSHVWAVGLTLWETIQRRCIFTKPSEFQGYMTPSSLTDLKEQVILELETLSCLDDFKRIIERCLDLEPSSRIEANDALQKSLEIKKIYKKKENDDPYEDTKRHILSPINFDGNDDEILMDSDDKLLPPDVDFDFSESGFLTTTF